MKDMLNTIHEGCGGTFREVNIYEDIRCDKCGQGTPRYIYTKEEHLKLLKQEEVRLIELINGLKRKINDSRKILNDYTEGETTYY